MTTYFLVVEETKNENVSSRVSPHGYRNEIESRLAAEGLAVEYGAAEVFLSLDEERQPERLARYERNKSGSAAEVSLDSCPAPIYVVAPKSEPMTDKELISLFYGDDDLWAKISEDEADEWKIDAEQETATRTWDAPDGFTYKLTASIEETDDGNPNGFGQTGYVVDAFVEAEMIASTDAFVVSSTDSGYDRLAKGGV